MRLTRPDSSTRFPRDGLHAGAIVLALAALALGVAGCGGSSAPSVANLQTTTAGGSAATTPSSTPSQVPSSIGSGGAPSASAHNSGFALATAGGAKAIAALGTYSACMRANGVPNFPNPNSSGVIQGSGIDPNTPQFQSASGKCQKDLPNGGQPTPAEQAKLEAAALAYSACMRSHGVPEYPDPKFSGGHMSVSLNANGNSSVNPGSPVFQKAQQTCSSLLPGHPVLSVGQHGPGSGGGVVAGR
jgi:hypothetical protein